MGIIIFNDRLSVGLGLDRANRMEIATTIKNSSCFERQMASYNNIVETT